MTSRTAAWLLALLAVPANLAMIFVALVLNFQLSRSAAAMAEATKGKFVGLLALIGLVAAIVGLVVNRRPAESGRRAWLATGIAVGGALAALAIAVLVPVPAG
ncbi:hypothetical protein [Microlunatus parietis]|uniref:Cobalamin synthase n=1 Tax=Microlunatus parietis TaxID=682979 RepID=A0A7Y9IDG6_9ACTN|nr:hypothetical protein [Microlunatus parietis]NYE74921.1 cobalamin synthase [Microlunatus parietis]